MPLIVKSPCARWVVPSGLVSGLLLAAAGHLGQLLWKSNWHVVLPGRVFRSAQLSQEQTLAVIRDQGIRTLINLRGKCEFDSWYYDECRAAHDAGIAHEDISLAAGRLPPMTELRYLVRVLDRAEYPILIHCRQGADRTGLVATLILLLYTDAEPAEALQQLSIRFGHVRLGQTRYMDQFFDLYAEWLAEQGEKHSPAAFRHWLERDYCPGVCRAAIEPLDLPRCVPADRPWLARVRAHNCSVRTWPLRPGKSAGVHLGYQVLDRNGRTIHEGRGGLFHADVPRGQSIDLTVAMPPLKEPGWYGVMLDMIDEQQCWFFQAGSPTLQWQVEVAGP
jgi:protein tyrosine phosphatase (PTP) superfamily phosphohydrolase (DUF442 family)